MLILTAIHPLPCEEGVFLLTMIKTYFENGSKDDYRFVMAVYERYCLDKQRVREVIKKIRKEEICTMTSVGYFMDRLEKDLGLDIQDSKNRSAKGGMT